MVATLRRDDAADELANAEQRPGKWRRTYWIWRCWRGAYGLIFRRLMSEECWEQPLQHRPCFRYWKCGRVSICAQLLSRPRVPRRDAVPLRVLMPNYLSSRYSARLADRAADRREGEHERYLLRLRRREDGVRNGGAECC